MHEALLIIGKEIPVHCRVPCVHDLSPPQRFRYGKRHVKLIETSAEERGA